MNNVNVQEPKTQFPNPSLSQNRYATAMASGDPRYQMKKLDRAGLSRGAAQRNQAGIAGAAEMAAGIADAYGQQLQDGQYASRANMQQDLARENQAQALGALQQQQAYANQMAALQRQGTAMNMFSGILGGLLG
jgi:hypothetical protein